MITSTITIFCISIYELCDMRLTAVAPIMDPIWRTDTESIDKMRIPQGGFDRREMEIWDHIEHRLTCPEELD
jgi:hypothetical protein